MNLKQIVRKLERVYKDKLNEITVIKWKDGTIIWKNKNEKDEISNSYNSDLNRNLTLFPQS